MELEQHDLDLFVQTLPTNLGTSVTIKLGQCHPGNIQTTVKLPGHLDRVLTGHTVGHQE